MNRLYARIATAFIGITCGVLLISTIIFIIETHYHFSLYQHQDMGINKNSPTFDTHFEQALVQSVIWSGVFGIVLAIILSLIIAKRITSPLIQMKNTAERMANGELLTRTVIKGKDELAELGNSLNHLAEQLIRQEQLRKTMTADVAHELRTPLTTLKSHVEAMIEGVWTPTPSRLESCYEEIERLRYLVGDLEQLTEMESPNFKLKPQVENVATVVQHHVEASRAAFEQKGVLLIFQGVSVQASLDRVRFGQIIINLLSNALKFTSQGGKVSVEVNEEIHTAKIIVSDTGIGVSENDLQFVFERFYRADKSRDRKSGGSGIGLTIVKGVVEAHGGTISMQSQVGEGTSVEINIPKYL